jgi:hypothetical protein
MSKDIKFYEIGRVPGDYHNVHNKIEAHNEWAIAYDHSEVRWEIWVDGEYMAPSSDRTEAQKIMDKYIWRGGKHPRPEELR